MGSREDEAADLKSKAMSLLKYAEKVSEEKSREIKERMASEEALLEEQRAAMEKAGRAREDLEQRETRSEATSAALDARAKAIDQREKRLKEESAALARERAEAKALWKNLESEGRRVSQKEEAIESLVAKAIAKEHEALVEQTRKVNGLAADLKGKDKSTQRHRVRLQALERDLQARKVSLETRDRKIRDEEKELGRRREEIRRMREKIEELL